MIASSFIETYIFTGNYIPQQALLALQAAGIPIVVVSKVREKERERGDNECGELEVSCF